MSSRLALALAASIALAQGVAGIEAAVAAGPQDPGVRTGGPAAGQPLSGLTADELTFFNDGLTRFLEVESASNGSSNGLGPRFNSNQCASCHSQPAIGGSSPANNPLIAVATLDGAENSIPWFIAPNGPIREARFKLNPDGSTDGGVHGLFVTSGRKDAYGCNLTQPNFFPAGNPLSGQLGNPNIVFRIPTPVFGAGLIESIPDSAIVANNQQNALQKALLGISGHPNRSGNDGTITRFGWKAQNKSLLLFSGEAYNVEMGISNQLFPQKRDETPNCNYYPTPNDTVNFNPTVAPAANANVAVLSDIEAFADFMRMLAPPRAAPSTPSIANGRNVFVNLGCAQCHTPSFTTGAAVASGSSVSPSGALSNQPVNLFSDLLVHHMGVGLADGITQGGAGPDEFRTAPLWGLGQRVFFMHDGRTSDLMQAINDHFSAGSEANAVVLQLLVQPPQNQQDLLNFLRSL